MTATCNITKIRDVLVIWEIETWVRSERQRFQCSGDSSYWWERDKGPTSVHTLLNIWLGCVVTLTLILSSSIETWDSPFGSGKQLWWHKPPKPSLLSQTLLPTLLLWTCSFFPQFFFYQNTQASGEAVCIPASQTWANFWLQFLVLASC